MYVNAFLFGIMCTLFAEMALVIIAQFIPKKRHDEPKNTRTTTNKEVK